MFKTERVETWIISHTVQLKYRTLMEITVLTTDILEMIAAK